MMRFRMVSHGGDETSTCVSSSSEASSPNQGGLMAHLDGFPSMHLDEAEVRRLSEEKKKKVITDKESTWKESVRRQMEEDLAKRVREALETPPIEKRARRRRELLQQREDEAAHPNIEQLNAQFMLELGHENVDHLKRKKWKTWRAKHLMHKMMSLQSTQNRPQFDVVFNDELSRSNHAAFPGVFGLETMSEGMKDYTPGGGRGMSLLDKSLQRQAFTKAGFLEAVRNGRFLDGSNIHKRGDGTFVDKYGVMRSTDGPFWPLEAGPLFATPRFKWDTLLPNEPFSMTTRVANQKTFDNQPTAYTGKWRGVLIVYDSERSPRDDCSPPVPDDCCPSLRFESRFESGNLRQARRIGQFEYELVLKTDLYTNRHTQWYYFRVQNALPGITYKFRVVNLLKKDSLYNQGMRPLIYSEKEAKTKNIGWLRTGHHISYARNVMNLHCPLLMRGVIYYMLEWQMEFPQESDTCYMAHCYPYTFTDLKDDLDRLIADKSREACIRREVMCETRAGNSCFLLTVSDFNERDDEKKAVVITGRVHPGESNASWMMKGVLEYVTSPDPTAKELRKKFIFKIVPMLNPDGVIVGNYRCSLAARDLNRNYRHPRKETFPSVWYTKVMIEKLAQEREIALYCDLHGHSRKHNVFMYGNNTGEEQQGLGMARAFVSERIFPWLMAEKSPDKFTFNGCKFSIRKCKESTGRVVMWRQMQITNSFTLEATFSGTSLNKSSSRHFNMLDFQDMGQTLVKVVGDYHLLQEDSRIHSQVILKLTRFITRQLLESRGFALGRLPAIRQMLPQEMKHIAAEDISESEAGTVETEDDGSLKKTKSNIFEKTTTTTMIKATDTFLRLLNKETSTATSGGEEKISSKLRKDSTESGETLDDAVSIEEFDELCDMITPETMDGCFSFLDQLNVRHAIQDSDSSDSDSESEAEMKIGDSKKKKKRKSKKQRDNDRQKQVEPSPKKPPDDFRPKTVSTSPNLTKMEKIKLKEPLYISKYEGRHNNGIPCFSKERSVERAAKRLAEVRKRKDDGDGEASYLFPEVSQYQNFIAMVRGDVNRATTQDDMRRRFQVALHEGTPNVAQTLVGLNVRTGYTHADEYQDIMPSVQRVTSLSSPTVKSSHHYHSSSSDSENDYESASPLTHINLYPRDRKDSNNYRLKKKVLPQQYTSSSAPLDRKPPRTVPAIRSVHAHRSPLGIAPSLALSAIPPSYQSIYSELLNPRPVEKKSRTFNRTYVSSTTRPYGVRHSSCE